MDRLLMRDEVFGWTVEMQVKATEMGMSVVEVPVTRECVRDVRRLAERSTGSCWLVSES